MRKILILSANPTDTAKLRLDEEVRKIEAGLERSHQREQFQIITKWAVRPEDLRRALLDNNPEIVHFSGHGGGNQGLALENDAGEIQLVSTESLTKLFKLFKGLIECVLLNACYSEVQAEAIHQYVDCVVGMSRAIGDRAAVKFAVGFYDALGAKRSYEDAYEFGCTAIDLEGIPESSTPVLKSRRIEVKSSQPDKKLEITQVNISLENPEGQVPLASKFYIERSPIETDCYEAISQPGALIRIKAPRQMGKTSLMTRILDYAKKQGHQTASLNLQSVDVEFLSSLDQFLQWLCASIADELGLPDKLDAHWQGVLGSKNKCTNYLQRYLLPTINSSITLGLDEVDEIFKFPKIAGDFLGLLRAWHEKAKNEPIWQKLQLAIVHSKEVYIPLNINQSPFNVGLSIELSTLNHPQIWELIKRHGLSWNESEMEGLTQLVGGHPYLARVALYEIARGRMTIEKLKQVAPTEQGPYSDHLRRHLLNLEDDLELFTAMKKVVISDRAVEVGSANAFKLHSMGLVKFQGNEVVPLCNLYRHYFLDRLGAK